MSDAYPSGLDLYGLSNLISSIVFIGLAVLVFLKATHRQAGRIFALWCISVGAWAFCVYQQTVAHYPEQALFWSRGLHVFSSFIPVLFLHFILSYLNNVRQSLIVALYAVACTFGASFAYTNTLFIREVSPITSFAFYPKAGPAYPLFLVYFSTCVLTGFYDLWKAYQVADLARRNQMRYLLSAMIIGFGGGTTTFLHVFDIPIFPYGNYGLVTFCAAMITYAIVKHRLMDITVVIHKSVAYGFLLASIFIPTYLAVAASERATLYSVPPLLAGTLIIACGLWVLMKQPEALVNITFSLVCGAVSIWLLSFFMVYSSADEAEASVWGRCVYVGVVYIPALFYHFTSSVLQRRKPNKLIAANYFTSTVFLMLLQTPYLVNGNYTYFWGHYPKAGLLHPLFLMYFGLAGGWSLFRTYKGHLAAQSINAPEAARLRTLFWAFAIGYVSSLDFAQAYGREFYPVGYVLVSVCVLIVTYTLLQYQETESALMPTSPRSLLYVQTLGLIPVYVAVLLLIRLFTGTTQYLLTGILLATFLIFAGALAGIQKRVEQAIARILFKQRHDAYETLIEFSKAMVTILDLSSLSSTIMDTLARALGIEKISLFLQDKEKSQYYLATAHGLDFDEMKTVTFSATARLPQHLARTRSIVVLEEVRQGGSGPAEQAVLDSLQLLQSELSIPLVNKERLIGFLNFGKRVSRSMYSEADLALLTTLAQNAAVALDNAMLYEDLRRSRLLMRRTDRLRSLETIAGGFAHEIRNPLTSIKTFVQLAPERKHDDEFMGHFSRIVHEDVLRIERLIQEILDYARYMEPKFSVENLNDLVSSCLYFVEVKAESKNITVEKDFSHALPNVMLDRQQIKQVLLNLLINAMEAMSDRGGRLILRTRPLNKPGGDQWGQIEVRDTGPGIAPADLDHIFDPFYTTKHHSEEREGTGLGLTIVHQIIQEHHGYIEVESQQGRGTTFFVNLPVRQPEDLFSREGVEHEKTDSVGR
ncbi:MAG TPA: ATP-binding protein [Nitrospiraceae bacterium]